MISFDVVEPTIDADILRVSAGPGALHVERYGQGGSPIVLLHGFGTSTFLWRDVAPVIASAGHTAFAIDLMGYGESDRPLEGDYSIAAQAEYLDRVLTALRLFHPTIVGVDIAGGIAQRLALTSVMELGGLALINSVGFDDCPGRDVKLVQRATARFAFRVARGVLGAAPLLTEVLRGGVANPEHMPDQLIARYLAPYVGQEGVVHLLTLARALEAEDVEFLEIGRITTPTLIVWGDEDRWLDSGLAERLQGAIPRSGLVRLPGVARLVPEEAPGTLSDLLLEFVNANPAPMPGDPTRARTIP